MDIYSGIDAIGVFVFKKHGVEVALGHELMGKTRRAEMKASIKRSWNQVKQMEAGELPTKSALSFIDEL